MGAWKLALVAAFLAAVAIPANVHAMSDACDPYPYGRCGAYDREVVNFCYLTVRGLLVDATDHHVVALGTSQGVALPENGAKGLAYLRLSPTEGFLADPYESDLPTGTLIMEANHFPGAQLAPFKCGDLIWYPECGDGQWMGPYNIQPSALNQYHPVDETAV